MLFFLVKKADLEMKKNIFFLLLFISAIVIAQEGSAVKLDSVVLTNVRLSEKSKTLTLKISDSILENHTGSFTDLLRQNSSLYFKELGAGMASSVSFRGTNAAQTAVIWNGININSQTTGQTDFNNVGLGGFNELTVRSGGGSPFFGSGAIGGSIHLQHHFIFQKRLGVTLQSTAASFDNYIQSGNFTLSNTKNYFNGYARQQSSENDYKYLGTNLTNENGEFENFSGGFNFGHRLGKLDIIKAYFSYFTNKRNLSNTLTVPSKSRLDDVNRRMMLAWTHRSDKTIYNLRLANLEEEFVYYENKLKKHLGTGSNVVTYIVKADVDYKLNNQLKFKGALDGNLTEGEGDNIGVNVRRSLAGILSITHQPIKKFIYTITGRKEFTSSYKIPFMGSLDAGYQLFKWYNIGINVSRNFRIPTYNDLYWLGLGNPTLQPEISNQVSLNHFFKLKNHNIQLAGFYIDTQDMIKWAPDVSGVWKPQNFAQVKNWGVEINWNTKWSYLRHQFNVSGNYAFTKAIDQESNNQLIYVPVHKLNAIVGYQYQKISLSFENLWNDDVFTSSDNTSNILDYSVLNARVGYLLSLNKKSQLQFSARVNNILSRKYEVVESRPMPNRNFLINIKYKFN